MLDAKTVAVGLDVHKSSVRLAAVRGGELVRETTLPMTTSSSNVSCGRGRGRGSSMRPGQLGSGSTAIWSPRASTVRSWRRGWCRRGRVTG